MIDSLSMNIITGTFVISSLIYCCFKKIRTDHSHNHNEINGISNIVIENKYLIPITTNLLDDNLNNYSLKNDLENNLKDVVCIICLENFKKNDIVTELYCKHLYHKECIFKWFNEKKYQCPMCREFIFENIIEI